MGADGEIEEGEDVEEDEMQMMAAMGFGGFDTTKVRSHANSCSSLYNILVQGKAVVGNQQGAANVKKQRTWRQYMNRRGGFNRCASFTTWISDSHPVYRLGLWTRSSEHTTLCIIALCAYVGVYPFYSKWDKIMYIFKAYYRGNVIPYS